MVVPAGVPSAAAADTNGSIAGQVRDITGRPVAGAIVRVSSPAQVTQTTSDANGRYCFVGLVPETYALLVEKSGFAQAMYVGIRVSTGNQTIANAVLNRRLIGWLTHFDVAGTVRPGVQVVGGSAHPR